jgi:probable rRNA maturation factor|tara:strand:+ start:172 stop:621 length:450 start_codon:yes stop_codon:yes gene_type:complete
VHEVEVSRSTERLSGEPDEAQVAFWLEFVLDRLECQSSEVSVRIVGEEEIASLNAQYRGLENATNVLSFPAGISVEEVEFLGDIVICSKVVKLESDLYGRGFADRYVHMLIHGLLHLLGYDHMEEMARTRMEQLETDLLSRLDMCNPYE